MSTSRKEYFNPEESPLWVTAHKRRPEFSKDYMAFWFARYGFVLLVCFFFALVLSAIAFLPELRTNRSFVATLDSLQNEFQPTTASLPVQDTASTAGTLLLNVSSEPSGQTVYIDFDSVGVTPLYSQRLETGVYVISTGFNFNSRQDTVIVATNSETRWLLFGNGQAISYRSDEALPSLATDHTLSDLPSGTAGQEPASSIPAPARQTNTPASGVDSSPTTKPKPRSTTTNTSASPPVRQPAQKPTVTANSDGGTLIFESVPVGALVLLDNVLVGTTPLTLVGVPDGSHSISVQKDGFEDYSASVSVKNSESLIIEASLASSVAHLTVLVEPWGSIYIDGKLYKLETDIEYTTDISAGAHVVTATHPSLGSVSRDIVVSGGERLRITMSFDK